ncbi:MAG TPA: L-histidine N(alpha)-methyltransferase [Terriglobales bacterium]|jgi:dimethylhistidine N-methyltransferase|nr:L-histidine N(alpha)-methyltransferase [Terriglobales bacterium]
MIALEQRPISEIAADALEGLTRSPKALPPKLFYDAEGSALFEEITRLPEYYLTRTELSILEQNADEICRRVGSNASVVELGAGSARKTRTLIRALARRQLRVLYVPVDISRPALAEAQRALEAEFHCVKVRPVVRDFSDLTFLRSVPAPRLVLYIGSSVGNLEERDAISLLGGLRRAMSPRDHLLLGTDLVKPRDLLLAAYDDAAGVTARFNKNMLARINRELGGHFDLDAFEHVACWNQDMSRIEIYLESLCHQTVVIDALRLQVSFAAGERLHTENSYKYTIASVRSMLERAGLELEQTWTDPCRWFAIHLCGVPRA